MHLVEPTNVRLLHPSAAASVTPRRDSALCPSCATHHARRKAGIARRRARVQRLQRWLNGSVETIPGMIVACLLVLALATAAMWVLAPNSWL